MSVKYIKPSTKYTITGQDKSGKRFNIDTDTPWHYNIWKGTLWRNDERKRTRLKLY